MANYADQVIAVASGEVGYLEKKSNAQLYDKTANAGYANIVKYWADTYPAFQGQPWCDDFVSWCFIATYGDKADYLLCGGVKSYYTPTSAQYYQKAGRLDRHPQKGDQVFFSRDGSIPAIHHTGIVEKVDANYVYTIEGNTSSTAGVIPNGGGVWRKKYLLANYKNKMYFGHPRYDEKPKDESKKVSYAAIVNVKSQLNVRKTPNGEMVKVNGHDFQLPPGMVIAICEERSGWGRLSDIQGWVSLSYLQR